MLAQEDRFTYLTSDSTIRVRVTDGDLRALLGLGLVIPIPRRRNYFADIFWERGFTIEKLEPGQANDLRKQIEAIATVTLAPDIAQTHFCTVSGQVYQTNGVPSTPWLYRSRFRFAPRCQACLWNNSCSPGKWYLSGRLCVACRRKKRP